MEFVQNFTPPDFQAKNFTPSISHNFNSFSKKRHKKWVKMEKFTPLAKIVHCRWHWRHGQIPPLAPVPYDAASGTANSINMLLATLSTPVAQFLMCFSQQQNYLDQKENWPLYWHPGTFSVSAFVANSQLFNLASIALDLFGCPSFLCRIVLQQ